MSATRDKSQKVTFVYSNLYSIYRKGVERAREGAIRESDQNSPSRAAEALIEAASLRPARNAHSFESGLVIKAKDLRAPESTPAPQFMPGLPLQSPVAPKITSYTPAELIGKRVARPTSPVIKPAKSAATPAAVGSLKENLQSLNDLQARLRFMLQELEDLIKE